MRYSVPHGLVDTRVWARFPGDELIVTAVGETGPAEVAHHPRSTPGTPSIQDEHYPPRRDKEAERTGEGHLRGRGRVRWLSGRVRRVG